MTSILNTTRIYVDADACPVKDEIYRVAGRHGLPVSVVAGNFIRVPQDPLIERIAAGSGMDAADDWIAERAGKDDIVITSDIPLASRCVKAGAEVIAPNGKPFTEQSIGMTLAVRNLMTDLRSSGEVTGGPRSTGADRTRALARAIRMARSTTSSISFLFSRELPANPQAPSTRTRTPNPSLASSDTAASCPFLTMMSCCTCSSRRTSA